jgi:hypothetical protein
MPVRCTFFFEYGRTGWSETHYYLPGTTLDQANDPALSFAKSRANLLGGPLSAGNLLITPVLNYIRLSLDTVFRDSTLVTPTNTLLAQLQLTGQIKTIALDAGDFGNVSLRCRAEGGFGTRAIIYLAGVPESIFPGANTVSFNAVSGYATAFTQFQKLLTNTQWGFRSKVGAAKFQVQNVTAEAAAPNRIIIYVPAAFTVSVGDKVQLRNFTAQSKAYKPLNGVFTVGAFLAGASGAPNQITLQGTGGRDPSLVLAYGQAEKQTFTYMNYTTLLGLGPSSRKRGVGLGAPVGRRSPVKQYAG